MRALICAVSLLVLGALPPMQNGLVDAGPASHPSKEHADQVNTCHGMLQETPDNNPMHLAYPCPLLTALANYSSCGCTAAANGGSSGGLSASDQVTLNAWISWAESELENCNGEINDTVVVDICDSLSVMLEANVNIAEQISYLPCNDASGAFWGSVQDFVEVQVSLQFSVVESSEVITLNAGGSCSLMDSITAAAQASGDSSIQSECVTLNAQIKAVLQCASYNVTDQLAGIYEVCVQEHPALLPWLKAHVKIPGFGSFHSLFRVCEVNAHVQKMHDYMHGKDADDCAFLADFKAAFLATCVPSGGNWSQCATLGNLYAEINASFSASVDIESRMQAVSDEIYQFSLAFPWICSIQLQSCGCSLYEILSVSAFCHNEGCCEYEGPPPTLPASAENTASSAAASTGSTAAASTGSTAAPSTASTAAASTGSTAAATTPAASTAAPTTSASMCSQRGQIIAVSQSTNTSCIITAIIVAMGKMTASQRQSFNPCLTAMENVVYNVGNVYTSVSAQINAIINITVNFHPGTSLNTMLLAITVYFSDNVTVWGNIGQFCNCGNA